MARLYREAPLNGIWEGTGNVICLDVLRSMTREPDCIPALFDELKTAVGVDRYLRRLRRVSKGRAFEASQTRGTGQAAR